MQYFGRPVQPSEETIKIINEIPQILSKMKLSKITNSVDTPLCAEKITDANSTEFYAASSLRLPLHEKEKIFDQRAKQSLQEMKDNLIGPTGDTVLWTGIYIASQAHRYKVTKDQEAIRNLEPSLWAFHDLHKVTGNKSLVARRMLLQPDKKKALDKEWFRGGPGYEDYIWRGHISWDMYVGYLYGLSESWDVIQDQMLKAVLKEDMREIAFGFIKDGMAISGFDTYLSSDPDGCFSDHRKCGFLEVIAKNILHYFAVKAGNAQRALVLLQVASKITEDPRLKKAYQFLLETAWWRYARDYGLTRTENIIDAVVPIVNPFIDGVANTETLLDPVGSNLGHLMLYMLTQNETNNKIRSYYLKGFKEMTHEPVKNDGNSFWNLLLASQQGKNFRKSEVEDSIEGLYRFPLDSYENRKNSNNPRIPKYEGLNSGFFKSKDDTEWYSYEPLPIDIRPMHGFAWQNNAFRMDGEFEAASPGVPFLAAYWLARYKSFIDDKD